MEQAVRHIIEGIGDALREETLEGIGITLAGIDTLEDWKIMADGLKQGLKVLAQEKAIPFQEVPVVLENDVFGALMSVRGKFSGNVLAAGTGAVALGVNPEGEVIRVGGWGHLIGDQGAGYDIGRKALVAMVASFDGYGPKSILEEKITEHLGLAQVRGISDWLYQKKRTNKEVAALVPVVVEAARMGDFVSNTDSRRVRSGFRFIDEGSPAKDQRLWRWGLSVGLVIFGNCWNRLFWPLFKRSSLTFKYLSQTIPPLLEQPS